VLVEGDDDASLFDDLKFAACCTGCEGKAGVLTVLGILRERKIAGVTAIVDADYATLEGELIKDVHVTDTHDMETLMLKSPALRRVVRECLRGVAASAVDDVVRELRQVMLAAGEPVGCLRWASVRGELGLNFEELDPSEFFDASTLAVQLEEVIRKVRGSTRGPISLSDDELRQRVVALKGKGRDPWLVCQGHDLMKLLSVVLATLLERRGDAVSAERTRYRTPASLAKDLRLSYEPCHFQETNLRTSIKEWEDRNPHYPVLPRDD
jgi:hypothetical protein